MGLIYFLIVKPLLIGIDIDDMLSHFSKYAQFRFDDEAFEIRWCRVLLVSFR